MLNSQLKTSIDVSRQTRKLYAQVNMLLQTLDIVQSMSNVCCLGHIAQSCTSCCPLWFNSTSSSIKKRKASYNGVLVRRLSIIVKPYSDSEMFVTQYPIILRIILCIYSFRERISHSANKITNACLSSIVFIHSPIRQLWRSLRSLLYSF